MANVMLAARTATADTFRTVSATTGAITNLIDSASDMAAVAKVHSSDYLADTKLTVAADRMQRQERKVHDLARQDAQFYRDLNKEMREDSELEGYYKSSLIEYRKVLAPAE